jgi:N-acetylglucosamine kinase-like BadF-type ATPase
MIAYGRTEDDREARVGGWGPILGDGGGGAAIGMAILHAVTAEADESGPSTALYNAVLHQLGLQTASDLVAWTYQDDTPWARIAALAPLAVRCAKSGDAVAEEILHNAAVHLAAGVVAVARKLSLLQATFPVVLAGGNLHSGPLYDLVAARVRHTLPHAQIQSPEMAPAKAAALLALQEHRRTLNGRLPNAQNNVHERNHEPDND